MSIDTVRAASFTVGTAGAFSTFTADSTATSNPMPGPRANYSVQLTAFTTGTSGVGAAVVYQGTNDHLSWVAIGSATVTASQAGTATTVSGAVVSVTDVRYAAIRASSIAVTGTGKARVTLGA